MYIAMLWTTETAFGLSAEQCLGGRREIFSHFHAAVAIYCFELKRYFSFSQGQSLQV